MIPFKYPSRRNDDRLEFYDKYIKPLFDHDLINGELHLKEPRIISMREEDIIRSRFGATGNMFTYVELGEKYKITPSRIRQIEDKIFRKLRHPARKKIVDGIISGEIIPKTVYNNLDVMKQHVCDNSAFDGHCINCFNTANIKTVGDIVRLGQSGIRRKLFGGDHVQNKIKEVLNGLGVNFPYHTESNNVNYNKAMKYISKIDDNVLLYDLRLNISNIIAEKIK
jgi:hypothetical protein